MAGDASPAQLAAFAVLLRAKGETPDELGGLVRTMRERATPLSVPGGRSTSSGTGADRAHTVNISTMAALVVAGSGRPVVKHGNRAATSDCGSADVLEELGVAIDLPRRRRGRIGGRGGDRVLLRPGVPRRHAARRRAAPRARRADVLQLPRPADEPGPGYRGGGGLRRPADGAGDGRRARRPGRFGAGVPRRRRTGRADHHDHLERVGGRCGRRCARRRSTRSGSGSRRRAGGAARRRPSAQRRGGARRAGRRWRAGCAMPSCSTRRPGSPPTTGCPATAWTTRSRAALPGGRRVDRQRRGCRPARPAGWPRPPAGRRILDG